MANLTSNTNQAKINLINKTYYHYLLYIDMGIINYPNIKNILQQKLLNYSITNIKKHLNHITTLLPNQINTYLNNLNY